MDFKISKKDFVSSFSSSLFRHLKKNYKLNITIEEYRNELGKLYDDINDGNYRPEKPKNYKMVPKNAFSCRMIPVINIMDESLYFFLCAYLQEYLCKNRVENTFGGWQLGNPSRENEKIELQYIDNNIDDLYVFYLGYNPLKWQENWKGFMKVSKKYSLLSTEYDGVVKLDIANFYDNIQLKELEKKIYASLGNDINEKRWAVDWLMFYLKNWDRDAGEIERTVGIPQTSIADQSRILANLYLQDYDLAVKTSCDKMYASYMRFADDQLIFFNGSCSEIMKTVNIQLNSIGLNLNSSKTFYMSLYELNQFFLYDLHDEISYAKENNNLNLALDLIFEKFLSIYNSNKKIRFDIFFNRLVNNKILNMLSQKNLNLFIKIAGDNDYFINFDAEQMLYIYNLIQNKNEYEIILYNLSLRTGSEVFQEAYNKYCQEVIESLI